MSDYPYSALLYKDNRTLYMYTPYGGEVFIEAYRRNRQGLLETVEARVSSLVQDDAQSEPDSLHPENPLADTEMLIAQLESGDAPAESLDILVKKFETTRLIRKGYTPQLKILDREEIGLPHYARLAGCIARRIETPRNQLRLLNGLLKLNDYLAARLDELHGAAALRAFRDALSMELRAVERLTPVAGGCRA